MSHGRSTNSRCWRCRNRPAGIAARDAQAVIDDALPLAELIEPGSHEEAKKLLNCGAIMMTLQWAARAAEPEDVYPEALRDDFRRLLD